MPYNRYILAAAAVLLTVSGRASAQTPQNPLVQGAEQPYTPPPAGVSPAPVSGQPPPVQPGLLSATGGKYDYLIGAGDKLHIIVFGEETLTGDFVIAGNGDLAFPLIGDVPATGKTIDQLQDAIANRLRDGYLKDPRVSVQVIDFRPYFILGEVARPGAYPYSDGLTIMNAIATAGGFTYRAKHSYVLIKGQNDPKEHKAPLTDQLQLAPGDTIRVLERYF